MKTIDKEVCYEQKMDQISEVLEELVLDAMVAALEKIKHRNMIFLQMNQDRINDFERF